MHSLMIIKCSDAQSDANVKAANTSMDHEPLTKGVFDNKFNNLPQRSKTNRYVLWELCAWALPLEFSVRHCSIQQRNIQKLTLFLSLLATRRRNKLSHHSGRCRSMAYETNLFGFRMHSHEPDISAVGRAGKQTMEETDQQREIMNHSPAAQLDCTHSKQTRQRLQDKGICHRRLYTEQRSYNRFVDIIEKAMGVRQAVLFALKTRTPAKMRTTGG